MATNDYIPWKRISAEGVTIVVSIILAFSIDAWWDERQERRDEIEILERLLLELSVNIERIDRVMVNRARKLDYAVALFDQIENAQDQGVENIALRKRGYSTGINAIGWPWGSDGRVGSARRHDDTD